MDPLIGIQGGIQETSFLITEIFAGAPNSGPHLPKVAFNRIHIQHHKAFRG
ncbi:MAG: hypothetical protein HY881_05535 [Deltaproteobacteria bacterium]|nr:hypothetical protein [Deltaproteobacteria bacterium]